VSDGGHRHADGQKQTAEAGQQCSGVRHNGGYFEGIRGEWAATAAG
jgi:hypothetical protein